MDVAVDRWKGYVEHYIKEDAQLETAIADATSNLQTARKNLLNSRDKVAEKTDIADGGEISDEELLPDAAQPLTADLNKVVACLTVSRRGQKQFVPRNQHRSASKWSLELLSK